MKVSRPTLRAFEGFGGVEGTASALHAAGIDPKQRAEQVPLERWLALGRLCGQAREPRD